MRAVLLATVLTLGLTTAVSSQMCGSAAPGSTGTSAMGCMGLTPVDDPFADKSAAAPKGGMMCPCCKMAMMGGMKHEMPPAAAPKSDSPPGVMPKSDGPPAMDPKHDMAPMK